MSSHLDSIPNLSDADREHLARVDAALPITADVSRADMLLVCRLAAQRIVVVRHVMPKSISSHYAEEATGRTFAPDEQPLIFYTLNHHRGGRRQIEILSSGAPVIQDVYPILNPEQAIIGALVIETNMFAYERQRRRDPNFRHAVNWLQTACLRGDLVNAEELSRFGLYDGIYLADRHRTVSYMSGIAANLFRSIGLAVDMEGQRVSELEPEDDALVDEVFRTRSCVEQRHETEDGRVWLRRAIPLRKAPTWRFLRFRLPHWGIFGAGDRTNVDAVMVMIHNATDAVQKQRELNVKSAIIQEVHHRVKNNLQTVAAILRIQARRAESVDARQHLADAVNRILSVAVIHEFLSEDEHRPINIRDLCQRIVYQVQQVAGNPEQEVEIAIHGPNIRLPASQATPVAMVINELVLNALEHGVGTNAQGRIDINLHEEGNRVQVAIRNNGNRLPPDFDASHATSLGLQIVRTLVQDDLKGELRIETIPETVVNADGNGAPAQEGALDAGQEVSAHAILEGTQAMVTFPKRSLKVD